MSETFDDRDMAMSSGIAAFEAKQFTRAVRLLSPLAEEGEAEALFAVPRNAYTKELLAAAALTVE